MGDGCSRTGSQSHRCIEFCKRTTTVDNTPQSGQTLTLDIADQMQMFPICHQGIPGNTGLDGPLGRKGDQVSDRRSIIPESSNKPTLSFHLPR